MGASLSEYAAQNGPGSMPEADREQAAAFSLTVQDRERAAAEAGRLKESILQQLKEGIEPQNVLYTALKCIGGLTEDPDFFNQGAEYLENIYGDLAQRSFIVDNAAIAAARLEQQQADFLEKLKQQITRKRAGLIRIEKSLNEILQQCETMQAGTLDE